jgi:hypothetical protein
LCASFPRPDERALLASLAAFKHAQRKRLSVPWTRAVHDFSGRSSWRHNLQPTYLTHRLYSPLPSVGERPRSVSGSKEL